MYLDHRLWQFTLGFRWRIALAVLVGLASAAVGIARLALLGWLLARVFAGAGPAEMAGPLALVAGVMLLRGVLEYARTMIAHRTAAAVQLRLRRRLYDKVVELGPGFFGLRRTGEVILSLVDGVEQLETYFGQYLPQLCVSALTPLAIFAFAAFLDLPVAAVLLVAAIVTLLAPSLFHSWDRRAAFKRQRAYGDFGAEFLDALQGLATLKAFGQSRARGRLLAERAREVFRSTMWVLATNVLSRGITDSGIAIGAAAALAVGAWRVGTGEMSLTALLVILMLGVEVFRPLRDLRTVLHQGMLGRSAAESVMDILEAEPPVHDSASVPPPAGLPPAISFEAVTFRYPGSDAAAHRELSFAVDVGERVGVVGSSGAGKSSVVRLLLRLYDPERGAIRIGGVDIRALPLAELRRRIAVVNQDTYLFHGTVEENLRFGKPEASREELEAAARAANAHDFIGRLPQGYDTVVGERGLKLSGGQRQRIAIARALLRDAPILVLDEALSAVDAENEAVIQQALNRLMRGRTTLVFAHRLSSVIDADRILVLDDGRVAEQGSHGELMGRRGVYHALMAAQAEEGAVAADLFDATARPLAPAPAAEEAPLPASEPTDAIVRAEGLGWAGAARELIGYAMPWKGRLFWTFVFGVTRVLAFIGVGAAGAMVVGGLKAGEPVTAWLILLAALAPASGLLHWLESWLAHDMAFRLLAEMRIALYDKLERLAPAYLLRRRSGDLVSMATQDVETVEYFFAHTLAPAFVAVLVPLAVLGLLTHFGPAMALALLPFLAVVVISPFLMRDRVDRLGSRAREALGDLNAHATDTVQGLLEIVAFQQEAHRGDGFDRLGRRHVALRLPFFRDLTLQTALIEVATGLGGVAVIAAGAAAAGAGEFDARYLPLLTLLAMAAFLPVSEIANIGRQLADTLGATRRLYAVHAEPVTITDGPGVAPAAAPVREAMALDDVTSSYPGTRRAALERASFTVEAGQTLALVGPSGAGKTTAAHLFLRFWDPDSGSVRLDGHDLRLYRLEQMQQQVALVAQDTYLFNDTLGGNIALARPQASEAEIRQAVHRAALEDVVRGLPDGLETRVGERGMRLSGGQRQRVAIARAFLKDAPILILDEATSHLDAVNEQLVRRALDALMATRTTVVIAHRLSTVRNADVIVALDEGRVVEVGSHDALLARGGLYAHLVARQMAGAAGVAAR